MIAISLYCRLPYSQNLFLLAVDYSLPNAKVYTVFLSSFLLYVIETTREKKYKKYKRKLTFQLYLLNGVIGVNGPTVPSLADVAPKDDRVAA